MPPPSSGDLREQSLQVAERSFVELGSHLSRLIGIGGYRALVGRALRVAAAEFPVLSDVRPGISPPGRLVGLHRGKRHARSADVLAAVTATLVELLGLLDQFMGEDLTQSIVRDVSPRLAHSRFGDSRRLTG